MKKTLVRCTEIPLLSALFGSGVFIILCVLLKTTPDRLIGAAFCHQIASRSPAPDFPFCYRCCGMFYGIFWGLLAGFVAKQNRLISSSSFIMFAVSVIVFLMDAANSSVYLNIHWYPDKPVLRFFSAFPFGFFLACILVPAFISLFEIQTGRDYAAAVKLMIMIGTGVLSGVMLFYAGIPGLYLSRFIIVSGSFIFIVILYSILIKCINLLRNKTVLNAAVILTAFFSAAIHVCCLGGIHLAFFHFDQLLP